MVYAAILLTVISFGITLWKMPETPRYYYSKKMFDKARDVIA